MNLSTDSQLISIRPNTARFSAGPGGYLNLTTKSDEYTCIRLKRALPYKYPEKYICVCDREDKEIGILSDLAEWTGPQRELLEAELKRLYYIPNIEKILSAKDRMGYLYFEVLADGNRKSFAVRDPSRSIRFIAPGQSSAVQITDTEGNRYRIANPAELDGKSRRTVETYLI